MTPCGRRLGVSFLNRTRHRPLSQNIFTLKENSAIYFQQFCYFSRRNPEKTLQSDCADSEAPPGSRVLRASGAVHAILHFCPIPLRSCFSPFAFGSWLLLLVRGQAGGLNGNQPRRVPRARRGSSMNCRRWWTFILCRTCRHLARDLLICVDNSENTFDDHKEECA